MSPGATVWLVDEFLIAFGQQQNSVAQRNIRSYQGLDTWTILVSGINPMLVLVFEWNLLTRRNTEYHQLLYKLECLIVLSITQRFVPTFFHWEWHLRWCWSFPMWSHCRYGCGSHRILHLLIIMYKCGLKCSVFISTAYWPKCVPQKLISSCISSHTLPLVLLGEMGFVSEGVLNKPQQSQNMSLLSVITPLTNKE